MIQNYCLNFLLYIYEYVSNEWVYNLEDKTYKTVTNICQYYELVISWNIQRIILYWMQVAVVQTSPSVLEVHVFSGGSKINLEAELQVRLWT